MSHHVLQLSKNRFVVIMLLDIAIIETKPIPTRQTAKELCDYWNIGKTIRTLAQPGSDLSMEYVMRMKALEALYELD